jgi:hypothetical protein
MVRKAKAERLVSYVPAKLKAAIERIAAKRGLSASVLVILVLTEFVEKEGKS